MIRRMIVEHPWYRTQLKLVVLRLARRHLGRIFSEDIEPEAILFLARSLRHSPDFQFNPFQPDEKFSPWMRKIILRDCRQVLRRLRRGREMESLTDQPYQENALSIQGFYIDLKAGLELLPRQERFVIEQYLSGQSLDESADQLNVSMATIRRRVRRALSMLQQSLH